MHFSVLLSLLLAIGQGSANRTMAPTVPPGAAAGERFTLDGVIALCSKSRFEDAEANLRPYLLTVPAKVATDLSAAPPAVHSACRAAVNIAVRAWNSGLGGAPALLATNKSEGADVILVFQPAVVRMEGGTARGACGTARLDIVNGRRVVRVAIAVSPPGVQALHIAPSLVHLVGQGLGSYLGVNGSQDTNSIMGPDTHLPEVAVKPSEAEVDTARKLQAIRLQLLDYARRKVVLYIPHPTFSVDRIEADAGDVWRGEKPRYVFILKNTGDAPMTVLAKPNCGCTVANYDTTIPPGGSGRIVADMATATFKGKISKTIDVSTNDPAHPRAVLQLKANVKSIVTVLPADTMPVGLKIGEPTLQALTVQMDPTDSVEMTGVICSSKFATAKMESTGQAGRYQVTVTIGQDAPMGRSMIAVSGTTTSKREPHFTINLLCEKGVVVTPVSAYMGSFTAKPLQAVNQIVTLSRQFAPFHITKVESGDPNLLVRQQTVKEGERYILVLSYTGGWSPGIIERKIVVLTDDPMQPRIEIPVRASVLPGGTG